MIELFKLIIESSGFWAIMGGMIGMIGTFLVIKNKNKQWIFNESVKIRVNNLLEAYADFLEAYFKINKAANIGEDSTSFEENINVPLSKYLVSINKIDIWVSKESSNQLREILGIFRKINHEIWLAKGKQPKINHKDWIIFDESLKKIKSIISKEIRSEDLKKFISTIKIK